MTSTESDTTVPNTSLTNSYPNAYKDFYPYGRSGTFLPSANLHWRRPHTLLYDGAFAAAHDSKGILVEAGFPNIEVAFVESVAPRRYSGTSPSFLPLTTYLWPGVHALVKPFITLLGVSIALLEHPDLVGTGGLIFHLGKDSDDKPVIGLLTCAHVALPPTVYGAEFKRGRTTDASSPPIHHIALGEAEYKKAIEAISDFTAEKCSSIEVWTASLERETASLADAESGQLDNDLAQKRKGLELKAILVDMAQEKIKQAEKLRAVVLEKHATPNQRLLGSLLYSAPLQVSPPDRFTSDWAMIAIGPNNIQSTFSGNKVYIGDNLDINNFRKLLYPCEADKIKFVYPPDGLLQVAGVVEEAEIRNPKTLDEHGEPCLFAIKNGASTGTTVGRVNGIESFVRSFADGEEAATREFAALGCRHRVYDTTQFSSEGDSGAVVVTRDGQIVGILNSGQPGMESTHGISYITPYWWLERQIKEKFPYCYLYEGVH